MPTAFQTDRAETSRRLDGARRGGGCCEKWVGLNPSGKGPTAAPPRGNGSTGSALGGVQQEFIKVRNSRHEISLSFVRISASGCTYSVIRWAIVRLKRYLPNPYYFTSIANLAPNYLSINP